MYDELSLVTELAEVRHRLKHILQRARQDRKVFTEVSVDTVVRAIALLDAASFTAQAIMAYEDSIEQEF